MAANLPWDSPYILVDDLNWRRLNDNESYANHTFPNGVTAAVIRYAQRWPAYDVSWSRPCGPTTRSYEAESGLHLYQVNILLRELAEQ